MSQCGDYEDINFYVINVFYGIVLAVYFLPFKKNHPVQYRPAAVAAAVQSQVYSARKKFWPFSVLPETNEARRY